MEILVLNPFGQTEPSAKDNLSRVVREDVDLTIENISEVFPLEYNTYRYNNLKCANAAVEHIIRAEENFDGVVLSCQAEPGIHDARSVVDIPVVGTMEASCQLAQSMGRRYSVVVTDRTAAEYERDVIESHSYDDALASFRWIDIHACDLYPEKTDPEIIQRRSIEEAQKCVSEDNAEVIVSGCTLISAILTSTAENISEVAEVPIIDAMEAGLKACEMRVDLQQKGGYPSVSRLGRYRKPPEQEFEQLRQWMRTNESPEQHYIEGKDLEYDELAGSFIDI